jgi:hypothetical protein
MTGARLPGTGQSRRQPRWHTPIAYSRVPPTTSGQGSSASGGSGAPAIGLLLTFSRGVAVSARLLQAGRPQVIHPRGVQDYS